MIVEFLEKFKEIVSRIEFGNWEFHVGMKGKTPYLQIRFYAPNNDTGALELQTCRKWMLSQHMTTSEVVLTAWKAVQAAVEHEAREQFLYRGKRIFGPHIDVEALVKASRKIDARKGSHV